MTAPCRFPAWLVAASLLVCASIAAASPEYPSSIQDGLMLAKAPNCTLCHTNDLGGKGTISTYFGRTLLREGAEGNDDQAALKAALDAMDSQHIDSDGDGVPDIDELRMGTDPNDGPGPSDALPTPQTGCALRTPIRGSGSDTAWLPCLLFAWLARHRCRAARRGRKPEGEFRKSEH